MYSPSKLHENDRGFADFEGIAAPHPPLTRRPLVSMAMRQCPGLPSMIAYWTCRGDQRAHSPCLVRRPQTGNAVL